MHHIEILPMKVWTLTNICFTSCTHFFKEWDVFETVNKVQFELCLN